MATVARGQPRRWHSRPAELELLRSQPATLRASRDYHKPSRNEGWSEERWTGRVRLNHAAAYRGGMVSSVVE